MPIAAVETALRLKQEATVARTEAITELRKQRKDIDAQLKLLGAEDTEAPPEKTEKKGCSVCGDKTHDGRFHRNDPKPPKT
jgi:hypothetical protein